MSFPPEPCRCKLISLREYENSNSREANTYFTRTNYDAYKVRYSIDLFLQKELCVPFYKWERSCVCMQPSNPNMLYIQCNKCEEWFHGQCMGLSKAKAEAIEEFFCPQCRVN